MLTLAAARQAVVPYLPDLGTELIPLEQAHGRVLRAPILADRPQPPYNRVMMDGAALRQSDLEAGKREFPLAGTVAAGQVPPRVSKGKAVLVWTGAAVPEGLDTVIPLEQLARFPDHVTLQGLIAPPAGTFIHRQGSDAAKGAELVRAGVRLGPAEIALAAACGYSRVTVSRQPRVAIVSTGDELVAVDAKPGPYAIRRSNGPALAAALALAGEGIPEQAHFHDDRESLLTGLKVLLERSDLLLITGGVSTGDRDLVPGILNKLGIHSVFHGVAQRPGKPLWFGHGGKQGPIVFGLPGNPVSTLACFHAHVKPVLARLAGTMALPQTTRLAASFSWKQPLTGLIPCFPTADGRARLMPGQNSGDFATLAGCTGFAEVPPGPVELEEDCAVTVW